MAVYFGKKNKNKASMKDVRRKIFQWIFCTVDQYASAAV